jgi:hypothetical protein
MKLRQQSTTAHPIAFFMVLASDHISGATGLTPTVTLSKDGSGAFAAAVGAVTEIGSGWYSLAGNATDRNTLGELAIHATAATADPSDEKYVIVSFDPFDAVRLGLTALPNAAAGANGGLPTGDASGHVTLAAVTHTGATVPTVTTVGTLTTYTGNTPQTGDAYARLGAPAGVSTAADIAAVKVDTANIGTAGAGLTALGDTRIANLDAKISTILTTAMTESYAAKGAAGTHAQLMYEILALLHEKSVTGTTLTAYKLDGATAAGTYTLSDATSPTSIHRAT